MRKFYFLVCTFVCTLCALSLVACLPPLYACRSRENVILVGASSTPHSEILEIVKDDLLKMGYQLEIIVYGDYIMPNKSLALGDLDANYFQHLPYLLEYNKNNGTDLVSAGAIHYEPMGIFGKNITSLDELTSGCQVIIPSDPTNQARALLLLADNGLITLFENVSIESGISVHDIKDKKGLVITQVEAVSIPSQLNNASGKTIGVINGNYALNGGLSLENALATEGKESDAGILYANILAVEKGNENNEKILALLSTLKSEKVKNFIIENYKGAVLPSF